MTLYLNILEIDSGCAATVKPVLTGIEYTLMSLDYSCWLQPMADKAFYSLVITTVDTRPKVRKRAQEVVAKLLETTIPPTTHHPLCKRFTDFTLKVLQGCKRNDANASLHILALLKLVASHLPPDHLLALAEVMLNLPKFNNGFLSLAVFGVFEGIFAENSDLVDEEKLAQILNALLALKPNADDFQLDSIWIKIMSLGLVAYSKYSLVLILGSK